MHNIEYSQLLILIVQCFMVAAFLLFFFRLRTIFGLGLFYIAIGLFKFMHYFFTHAFSLEIAQGIHILIGPTVITPAILFALLLIYIREDAGEVRKIIYALIFFNFFFAVMLRISALGINGGGFVNKLNLPEQFFRINIGSLIAGSLVLFIDGIVLIVFYEFFSKKISSLLLRIFLTMTLVLFLHALIFNSIAFIFKPVDANLLKKYALSTLISKAISIPVYTGIFWLYFVFFEKRVDNSKQTSSSFSDVFNLLTYRQKYALTHDKLIESEEKYKKLTENTGFGIGVSKGTKLIFANKKLLELFMVDSIDRFNEKPTLYYLTPESREKTKERMKKFSQGVDVNEKFEIDIVRTDGEQRTLELGITNITIDGEPCRLSTYNDITERKQTEQALRSSEESLKTAQRVAHVGNYKYNLKTGEVFWSDELLKIYGLGPAETGNILSVEDSFKNVHPEDAEQLKLSVDKAVEQGLGISLDYRIIRPDGEIRYLFGFNEPEFDKDGNLSHILGTAQDITERKQAEKALKEAQSNLQALLDNRKDSIWSLDRNYNYLVYNKPYADVIYNEMGIRIEKGMNALDIHPKEVADFWKPKFDEVFQGKYVTFEFSHVLEEKEHFFEVYMNPIYTDHKVNGLSALSMDITDRKQAEKELTKLTTAVTQSPSIIAITDTNGNLEYVNPKFRELTGYSQEELIGHNPRILQSGEHSAEMYKELWETILSGKIWQGEFHNKKKNGELYWERASITPIFDEKGKIINYLKDSEDITESKQAEEELRKYREHLEKLVKERTEKLQSSNKELEAFAYSVSHDLRAPLRAIDGFTRILMEDYVKKLDDEGKRLGDIIQNNAQKMGKLIDDLLAFSRLGRTSMQFSNIDMKNMVRAIYHEATEISERERIKFSVAELPNAYGDTNMMRQVWMNLISNAIKFSSKRGKAVISISGSQDDENVTYRISDNGAGFDMQYVNKIFDVFQRLHTEKEYSGTGVGLSLVQRIIHRHKGKIWAESEVDNGATFYFSLPNKID